jgi:hypothetical protein
VRRIVFEDAATFLRRSSFGQVSLHGDVTPWLPAYPERPACPEPVHERVAPALSDPPVQAAERAGFTPSSYDRVIYVAPQTECPWIAVGVRREVFLNGELSPWHVVHELGHTFGLAHARGTRCTSAGACSTDEYGDPFSPMGRSLVDFSAYEKVAMGWLREILRARDAGTYRVGRPDVLAATPHALVVQTGRGEYWFEQRLDGNTAGLAVRTVEPDVPDDDLTAPTKFVSDPMHNGRLVVAAGQTFAAAGAFSVRYTPVDPSYADLRFAWTDRVRPTRPTLRAPTARIAAGRPFRVQWKPSRDTGSGLAFCLVRIDTRDALRVEEGASATAGPLMPGIHRISVSCTDRAGNRSRASAKRIRAVQG